MCSPVMVPYRTDRRVDERGFLGLGGPVAVHAEREMRGVTDERRGGCLTPVQFSRRLAHPDAKRAQCIVFEPLHEDTSG